MWALICCTPPMTRELMKSRTRWVSGALKAEAPRYVSEENVPLEPPQQPHCQPQLRFRSVPTWLEPAVGWAVLAPRGVGAGGDVVLAAVGVEVEDDEDLARVDEARDLRIGRVLGRQLIEQVEAHLDR